MKGTLSTILLAWTCLVQAQAFTGPSERTISGFAQGTSYFVKYSSDKVLLKSEIDSVLNIIDLSMSLYRGNSLIKTFNNAANSSVQMDPHMRAVVEESFRIYDITNGIFDITVFPLVELWGFGPRGFDKVPTTEQVDSVRQFVGMDKLYVEDGTLFKTDPRVQIDVNGIAQGYTVDVLAGYLLEKGIANFMVELGGEIRTHGQKADGSFKIMLDERSDVDPRFDRPVLVLRDKAITTSSIREKNYQIGDEIVSHHIHPVLGKPIRNANMSVTVIAPSAMLADALDNYLMCLSPPEAVAFVEKMPEVEMCIYFHENNQIKVLHSSGFNNYLYN